MAHYSDESASSPSTDFSDPYYRAPFYSDTTPQPSEPGSTCPPFDCATVIHRNTLAWASDLAHEAEATYERDEYPRPLPRLAREPNTVAFLYKPQSTQGTTLVDRDGGNYLANRAVFRASNTTALSDDDTGPRKEEPS